MWLNDQIYNDRPAYTDIPTELQIRFDSNTVTQPIEDPSDTYRILLKIWDKNLLNLQEQVYLLFLNTNNEVMCYRKLHTGKMDESVFDITLALACAVKCLAKNIIVAHNHPSGNLKPSASDIAITKQMRGAFRMCGMTLLDHVIISKKGYFSFSDHDMI
jgi:DNA repair protein RadC